MLFLSRAMRRWEPHRWQRLCSHQAHLWAIADFVPLQSVGDPYKAGFF